MLWNSMLWNSMLWNSSCYGSIVDFVLILRLHHSVHHLSLSSPLVVSRRRVSDILRYLRQVFVYQFFVRELAVSRLIYF